MLLSTLVIFSGINMPAFAADNDLSVSIRPLSTEVLSGHNVSFEIQWQCGSTNGGGCQGAQLEVPLPTTAPDDLPLSVEAFSQVIYGKPPVSYPAEIVGQGADRKIVWHFPASMAGSNSGAVTFMLKTDNYITPNGSTITPEVTFSLDNGARQTAATSAPATVRSEASLKVDKVKIAPEEDPYVGSDVTYRVRAGYEFQWDHAGDYTFYSNMCKQSGLWALKNPTVVDQLPPGTVFRSATNAGVYDPASHTVTWALNDSIAFESDGAPKCDASSFGQDLLVTVNYPEAAFTDAANHHILQTNNVSVTAEPWLRPDEPLEAVAKAEHYVRIGSQGEFTVQKGVSYAASNQRSRQFWRGAQSGGGDWLRGYLHSYSIEGTGNAQGKWSLVDMLPCGWTSPENTDETDCATPAYKDISFGANGSMSKLEVHWKTNLGNTGVCVIPEGHTVGDASMRLCEGLAEGQAIAMDDGEWITKFWLDQNPMKGGTKGRLLLFGSVSRDIPIDNTQAVEDKVYEPHFLTTGEAANTPVKGVTPAKDHPLWVTVENCTADNTVTWNGGSMSTNGTVVDSNLEGRCGYTRIVRDPLNIYAVKRVYNPELAHNDNDKNKQGLAKPGQKLRVEVVTQRDTLGPTAPEDYVGTFNPTVTDILPENLVFDPNDPEHPVYLELRDGEGSLAQKLGEPRLTVSEVTIDGKTRTKIVVDFPEATDLAKLKINDEISVGFDVRVKDNTPAQDYDNFMLVQAEEAATSYLICTAPGSYADPKQLNGKTTWGDLDFTGGVQGPDADSGCRTKKPYTIEEGPGMNAEKEVKGTRDDDFVGSPLIGSTDKAGEAVYRIPVKNIGNVDMKNIVVYDMLPRVGDNGVKPGADARDSTFDVFMTGPVTGLPAGAVAQYSQAAEPCRGELADKGGKARATAPAGCVDDWSTAAPADWSAVTAIRIDFGSMVWKPGDTYTGIFPAVAGDGDLTGIAWNNVAIAGQRTSDGTFMLPAEAPKVGLQLTPDLSWKKVNGANAAELLVGSEWSLMPVVPEGAPMPAGEWPRKIVDCTEGASCGEDRDPAAGKFTLEGIPWGTYDLVETKAPSGFVISKDPIRIVLGKGKLNQTTWTYELGEIENFKPGTDVTWEKVDPESNRLAGSQWQLVAVDDDGKPIEDATAIEVKDCIQEDAAECVGADKDPVAGKFTIKNVPNGAYHLIETKAPAGFKKLTEPIEVIVDGDTGVALGEIENEQVEVPTLPLTGGIGTYLFIIAGGVLLLITAYSGIRAGKARRVA